jgi:ankyrin repeat protein
MALINGNEEVVKRLLERGADVNIASGDYEDHGTPLVCAVASKNETLVRLLLERGVDMNGHRPKYESALNAAARRGCVALVELLLSHDMDINEVSGEGYGRGE